MSSDRPFCDATTPVIFAPETLNDAFCALWSISLASAPRCASSLVASTVGPYVPSRFLLNAIHDLTVAAGIVHDSLPSTIARSSATRSAAARAAVASAVVTSGSMGVSSKRNLDLAWCVDPGKLGRQRFRRGLVAGRLRPPPPRR